MYSVANWVCGHIMCEMTLAEKNMVEKKKVMGTGNSVSPSQLPVLLPHQKKESMAIHSSLLFGAKWHCLVAITHAK